MTGDAGRLRLSEAGEDLGANSTISLQVISAQSRGGLSVPDPETRGRVLAGSGKVRGGLIPLFEVGAGITP
jgi:hypothetical protein